MPITKGSAGTTVNPLTNMQNQPLTARQQQQIMLQGNTSVYTDTASCLLPGEPPRLPRGARFISPDYRRRMLPPETSTLAGTDNWIKYRKNKRVIFNTDMVPRQHINRDNPLRKPDLFTQQQQNFNKAPSTSFGGAKANPETFQLSDKLLSRLPENMRPPSNIGQLKAKYSEHEPEKIAKAAGNFNRAYVRGGRGGRGGGKVYATRGRGGRNMPYTKSAGEVIVEWTIEKAIEFAKWLLQLIVDNFEVALDIIIEVLGLTSPVGLGMKIVYQILKFMLPKFVRMVYYTFKKTEWKHGDSFWTYIASLLEQFVINSGLLILNTVISLSFGQLTVANTVGKITGTTDEYLTAGSVLSQDDWKLIISGGIITKLYNIAMFIKQIAVVIKYISSLVNTVANVANVIADPGGAVLAVYDNVTNFITSPPSGLADTIADTIPGGFPESTASAASSVTDIFYDALEYQ